ncbi:MAG: hypothetical protein ABIE74_05990, partial [Pseudomonadota bacterium]
YNNSLERMAYSHRSIQPLCGKEGDQMEKPKKGLSSFQTFWIFGCVVSFFGVILSKPSWIWTGLALLVVGVVAGVLKK